MRATEKSLFEDVTAVINLGGISNDPTAEFNPNANYEMNTIATESIAKQAKEAGVTRYLFASTCSVYDQGVEDAEADRILDETAHVNPKAAYSSSKFEAEQRLLPLMDDTFCPVVLRKGTLFGYSPRMRFDLVVNTFLKDALTRGQITIHFGGEMWRPLLDVRDAARAYIACLEADEDKVKGQIFNLVYRNMRISELALRVKDVLAKHDIDIAIRPDYGYEGVRNYRVSARKIADVLGFRPIVTIEESVDHQLEQLRGLNPSQLEDPRYYNIRWLKLLEEAEHILGAPGTLFGLPGTSKGSVRSLREVS
jgi:nucleoside-diphosphate-sugar epimerase